jgi:hypothetical protein
MGLRGVGFVKIHQFRYLYHVSLGLHFRVLTVALHDAHGLCWFGTPLNPSTSPRLM